MKKLTTLFLLAVITSIHYSDVGNYLVDQDGHRAVIKGHPTMTCYRSHGQIHGKFFKQRGSKIWVVADEWDAWNDPSQVVHNKLDKWYVEIENPVCDLETNLK